MSHIHVSAAYRSHIYENCDTPRSETYFVQATYVPRTCDVPATFLWRISDVSVLVWNFSFVCTAYQGVCATYVWRMKRTRDVSTTYVLVYVPFLSAAYLFCTNCFLSHLFIAGCDIGVQISVRPSTFTSKFGFLYISDSCEYETLLSHCP